MNEHYKKLLISTIIVIASLLVFGIVASVSAVIFMVLFNWIMQLFGITFVLPFKVALVLTLITGLINVAGNKLTEFIEEKLKPYKD